MTLSTIKQLDEWMATNCYNDSYGVGNRNIHEGYGLVATGNQFVWYYTERGTKDYLKYFDTEKEAVEYAFEKITSDKTANRHMVGFLNDENTESELLQELQRRNIKYFTDTIPYGGVNDLRYRIFVFGCDINKAQDLKNLYDKSRG